MGASMSEGGVTDYTSAMSLDEALQAAVKRGLIRPQITLEDFPFGIFYDLDAFDASLARLRQAFPAHWHHATAVKTNPLRDLLRRMISQGHGLECASIGEVIHSLSCGLPPADIVYDSPCKTIAELRYALEAGVHLNIDNRQELQRVAKLLCHVPESKSVIGVRINPLVGAGAVQKLSVSTRKSKFGIPCPNVNNSLTPELSEEREILVAELAKATFVRCIHVHTGSGGMGLKQMVDGCAAAVRLAKDINAERYSLGITDIVDTIDIGGGLPVTWGRRNQSPTFEEYSKAIETEVPELFDHRIFKRVVTEFGASLHCKYGWLASVVEVTKPTEQGQIAMIHAGSDLFMRQCYAPEMREGHPIRAYTETGDRKQDTKDSPMMSHDIAGPLCFAGDVVSPNTMLPKLEVGDIVVMEEAGGNTLSMATSHCSRRRPPVYGYSRNGGYDADDFGVLDDFTFVKLSNGFQYEEMLGTWA